MCALDDVSRQDVLDALVIAWREAPSDWGLGRVIASASLIAYGGEVDLRLVDDAVLLRGLVALVPEDGEDDPEFFSDPFAEAWERRNGVRK